MSRRTVAAIVTSAVFHTTAVAAMFIVVPRSSERPLFIDLTGDAGRGAVPASSPPGGTAAPRHRASAPRPAAGGVTSTASRPVAPEPPPTREPARVDSAPTPEPRPTLAPDSDVTARVGTGGEAAAATTRPSFMTSTDVESAGGGGDGAVGLGGTRPGQGLALALPGEGGSGTGSGGDGPEYGRYLDDLRRRVQELLRYPATARRRGLSGTVQLEVTIKPDGAIGQIVVVRSSSHAVLDDAALDTLRALSPEPFPAELPARPLRVRLPVVFELR